MSEDELNKITHGVIPDLTFLIDVPSAVISDRVKRRKEYAGGNDMATADVDVINACRSRYLRLAANNKDRIKVIDGNQYKIKVADDIISEFNKFIQNHAEHLTADIANA